MNVCQTGEEGPSRDNKRIRSKLDLSGGLGVYFMALLFLLFFECFDLFFELADGFCGLYLGKCLLRYPTDVDGYAPADVVIENNAQ